MYTKPSMDDLLEGVVRTLEHEVFPKLSEVPDAQRTIMPILAVLDRVGNEWSDMALHLLAENEDIHGTLTAVADGLDGEAEGAAVQRLLSSVTPDSPSMSARALAEHNRLLKSTVVDVMDALDVPALPGAKDALVEADAQLRGLALRIVEREVETDSIDIHAANRQTKATPIPDPIEEMTEKLEAYIRHTVHGSGEGMPAGPLEHQMVGTPEVRVTSLERMAGGASRDTWFFDVSYVDSAGHTVEERCVMQEEAVASVLESDEAPDRLTGSRRRPETEFRAVHALAEAGITVAQPLWIEPTGDWLGRPFAISRRVSGTADDLPLLEPENDEQRRNVFGHYVEILGALHALDPQEAGLGFLGSPTPETVAREQVEAFEAGYRRNSMEPHPAVEYLVRWCKKHLPTAAKVSVIHGDFRRGNFLYEGDRVTAMLDWEQVHLGDPVEEIAFMYWPMWTLEPALPLEEMIPMYERASGIEVDRDTLAFYRMFIELKMVVVLLIGIQSFFGTENRQLQYGVMPPGYAAEMMVRALKELESGGPSYDYRIASGAVRLV